MATNDTKYGFGKNPPYSLYQSESGMWGLIDGSGSKLEAVFKRGDNDSFSCVPWEVVSFDPQEGFELVAWYDPCEVWFNFTFDNTDYPAEYAAYLWKNSEKKIKEYSDILFSMIPIENHWLIENILRHKDIEHSNDDDFYLSIEALLCSHPELENPAVTNSMLDLVMRNDNVAEAVKIALWQEKVSLDYSIITYKEDYPDGI